MSDETENASLTEDSTNDEMVVECEDVKDGLQDDVEPDNRLTGDTGDTGDKTGKSIASFIPQDEEGRKKQVRNLIVAGVILAAVVLIFAVGLPGVIYLQASSAFDSGDYTRAIELYDKAGNFADASERKETAQKALYYEQGKEKMKKGDYESAISLFEKAIPYKDAKKCKKKAQDADSYVKAGALFDKADYASAGKAYAALGDYKDSLDQAKACTEKLMEQQDYANARDIYAAMGPQFEEQRANADDLAQKKATFESALQCVEDNKVDSALDYLGKLPDDFGCDGKTVGALKGQLNAARPIMDLAGTYKSCNPSKCKVTQTSKSTGYYYWWESTDTITGEDLSIDASLNGDGSVHLSGSVSFYRYTNFSTIGEYVNGRSVSKSFSLDVTGIPGSIPIDDQTSLVRNGDGTWSLSWSESDNSHDLYFDYLYTANFRYSK